MAEVVAESSGAPLLRQRHFVATQTDEFSEFIPVIGCVQVTQSFFSRPYRTGLVTTVFAQALKCLPTFRRPYGTGERETPSFWRRGVHRVAKKPIPEVEGGRRFQRGRGCREQRGAAPAAAPLRGDAN